MPVAIIAHNSVHHLTYHIVTFALLVLTSASSLMLAGQSVTRADSTAWMCVADAGVFPAANRVGVGWYPSYSIRAGVGRGNSTLSVSLFVDYYSFMLSEPGGLHSYLERDAKRRDFAVYPEIRLFRFFFFGMGFFDTHADHVTITSILGQEPWSGGDVNGLRFFCTIGMGWDIRLTENVSIPLGLYYRNTGYYRYHSDYPMLALRGGVNVRLK